MANNQGIKGIWTWLGAVGFIVLILACVLMIYPARREYERRKEFYLHTKAVAEAKRAERDALQKEVAALQSSPAAIEKIAREKLRVCKEGEIIMYYRKPAK